MKKTSIAILLALVIIFTMVPAIAFASLPPDSVPTVQYTFNLNYGAGTIWAQGTVPAGDNVPFPAAPTNARTGYSFTGWYTTPAGTGTAVSAPTPIAENTNFYAKWSANAATVNFDSQAGTYVPSFSGKYDGLVTQPAAPTRAGYTFGGWYKDGAGTTAWNFASDTIAANPTTIYAKWLGIGPGIQKVVDFQRNDGSADSYWQLAAPVGATIAAPPAPVRAGYSFAGWYTDAQGNTAWNFATSTVADNTILYAKWTLITLSITYVENGGTVTPDVSGITYTGDTAPTLTAPQVDAISKAGFDFGGWYYDAALTQPAAAGQSFTTNITLYAKWLNHYVVTFHKNDGSANDVLGYQLTAGLPYVVEGSKLATPTVAFPARAGYAAPTKWYSNAAGTQEFVFNSGITGTTVTSNVELYVKWVPLPNYVVTFESNGGTAVASQSISPLGSTLVTRPADPTRSGYTFAGWFSNVGLTLPWNFGADLVASNLTLYAKWAQVGAFRVAYTVDGGIYSAQDYAGGQTYSIPADPAKLGYTFVGWKFVSGMPVDVSAGDYLRYAGDHVTPATSTYTDRTVTSNVQLAAFFTQDSYTVTFFTSMGVSPSPTTGVHYNSTIEDPGIAVPIGYELQGWFTQPLGAGTQWVFDDFDARVPTATKVTGNITLYAYWKALYSVTLVAPAGNDLQNTEAIAGGRHWVPADNGVVVPAGSKLVSPDYGTADGIQNPTLANYTFVGWFRDAPNGPQWVFGAAGNAVDANLTLYAMFAKNSHTVTFVYKTGQPDLVRTLLFDVTTTDVVNPTLPGFTFVGWSRGDDGNFGIAPDVAAGVGTTTVNTIPTPGNATYYAVWTQDNSVLKTLTYRYGYGATPLNNILSKSAVPSGTIVTLLPSVSYAGHAFVAWVTDTNSNGLADVGEAAVTLPLTITNNTDLVAKWTTNTFTVTFDSQGGSAVASLTGVTFDTTIGAPGAPLKPGYTFGGWYKDGAGTTAWNFGTDKVVADTTLYAKWLNNYTVNFVTDAGLYKQAYPVADGTSVAKGAGTTQAPTDAEVAKAGYTFTGWWTAPAGGTLFLGTGAVTSAAVTGTQTVYAQYTVNPPAATYTVIFDSQGGSYVAPLTNVATGSKIAAPTPPLKSGSALVGWYKESAGTNVWNFSVDTVTADRTLYAKWATGAFNVQVFGLNDGAAVESYTANLNTTISAPAAPAASALYGWDGKWYTTAGRTIQYIFGTPVTAAVDLYPGWIAKTAVHFSSNFNGGPSVADQYVLPGGKVTEPTGVTRAGFALTGWYDITNGYVGSKWNFATDVVGTNSITLSAQWATAYTVTFDPNYAGSTTTAVQVAWNQLIAKPANPVRTGADFTGWNTKADGSGHAWDFTYDVVTGNTTLYAQWNVAAFTLYQQTNSKIVKTGTWSNFTKSLASGGSYARSKTSGASATIKFDGRRLDVIAMTGTTLGKIDVYLDGVKVQTALDLYASVASYQAVVYSTGDLGSAGPHTVKIVRSSASTTGKYIALDAVKIWGTIQ